MHWFSLLVSFLLGKLKYSRPPSLKETVLFILEEATYRSRKPITLLLGGLCSVLILCGGLFLSLIDFTSQYDRQGQLQMTASAASGLILVAASMAVFYWIFARSWPGVKKKSFASQEIPPPPPKNTSLDQALALLVMDFVKEREEKRQAAASPPPPQERPQQEPPMYTH